MSLLTRSIKVACSAALLAPVLASAAQTHAGPVPAHAAAVEVGEPRDIESMLRNAGCSNIDHEQIGPVTVENGTPERVTGRTRVPSLGDQATAICPGGLNVLLRRALTVSVDRGGRMTTVSSEMRLQDPVDVDGVTMGRVSRAGGYPDLYVLRWQAPDGQAWTLAALEVHTAAAADASLMPLARTLRASVPGAALNSRR